MKLLAPLLVVTACSQEPPVNASTPAPRDDGPATRTIVDGPQAPVVVSLEVVSGKPEPGATLQLRARVHAAGWRLPINMDLDLPAGATLVRGKRQVTLTRSSPGRADELVDFTIQLGQVPLADVVVVADSHSSKGGVHAEATYRFGRPEPVPAAPAKTGPELSTPRARFGPSTPIH